MCVVRRKTAKGLDLATTLFCGTGKHGDGYRGCKTDRRKQQ